MDVFRLNDSFTRNCNLRPLEYADNSRFTLVGIAGVSVAMLSVACNVIVFYVFLNSRKLRRQNYANPVLLAFFDIIVSLCYVVLHCAHVTAYRFQLVSLVEFWTDYVRPVNCLQHICVTICNFLLVVASLERLFANSADKTQKNFLVCMVRRKVFVVGAIFLLATIFKGTLFMETAILHLPGCPAIESYVPVWIEMSTYWDTVRFWVRKICTVVVPFILLIYCNTRLVLELRHRRKQLISQSMKKRSLRGPNSTLTNGSVRKHYHEKKGVRVATRTLLLVVGCYLLSNLLSTLVNFWQFFDPVTLETNYYMYLVVSDFSTLMTICGCASRLPIYCISDKRVKKALMRVLIRCRHRALQAEMVDKNLEKYSLVIVSNSLRSVTNYKASQEWLSSNGRRARDELALLLHNRRRILVNMTLLLGVDKQQGSLYERVLCDSHLTDIQEEESVYKYRKNSMYKAIEQEDLEDLEDELDEEDDMDSDSDVEQP